MGDEPLRLIGMLAGLDAQVILPVGQRTGDAQTGLDHHECDRQQMGRAEIEIPGPFPSPGDADPDQDQSEDHERDEACVEDEDEIGIQAVAIHLASLMSVRGCFRTT